MCKLILPSWNSNEPCFFPWERHRAKNYIYTYIYIYIHSKTNLRIDTAYSLRIHTWLWGPCIPLSRSCTLVTSPQGHPPFFAGKCSNPSAASNHDSKMSQNEGPMEWIRNGTILDGSVVGCSWMNQMLEKSMYRRCRGFCWDHVCRSLHSIQFDQTCFILTPSHLSVEKLCCKYPGKWWTQKDIAGNDCSQLNANNCFFLFSLSLSLLSLHICVYESSYIYLTCSVYVYILYPKNPEKTFCDVFLQKHHNIIVFQARFVDLHTTYQAQKHTGDEISLSTAGHTSASAPSTSTSMQTSPDTLQ